MTVYSDVYDLYILREDAHYDSDLRDWIYQDNELNNDVLINKKRSEIIKNNRWVDLFSVNITPDDGYEENPQDTEYHPF